MEIIENDAIWAKFGHTTPLDPMIDFKQIIPVRNGIFEKHKPKLDTQDRERDNPSKGG